MQHSRAYIILLPTDGKSVLLILKNVRKCDKSPARYTAERVGRETFSTALTEFAFADFSLFMQQHYDESSRHLSHMQTPVTACNRHRFFSVYHCIYHLTTLVSTINATPPYPALSYPPAGSREVRHCLQHAVNPGGCCRCIFRSGGWRASGPLGRQEPSRLCHSAGGGKPKVVFVDVSSIIIFHVLPWGFIYVRVRRWRVACDDGSRARECWTGDGQAVLRRSLFACPCSRHTHIRRVAALKCVTMLREN